MARRRRGQRVWERDTPSEPSDDRRPPPAPPRPFRYCRNDLHQEDHRGYPGDCNYVEVVPVVERESALELAANNAAEWNRAEARAEAAEAKLSECEKELERHCACIWDRNTTGEEGPYDLCPYHADLEAFLRSRFEEVAQELEERAEGVGRGSLGGRAFDEAAAKVRKAGNEEAGK